MRKLLILSVFLVSVFSINAQTKEELQSQKAEKQAEADKFQAEANALKAQIDALPGWNKGAFGTIGGSYSEFNNWYSQDAANNSSANLGFIVNAFANLKQEKFFWRNAANVNLAWIKLDDKDDPTDSDKFREATDVFSISSLYGRNISKTFAISGLAEYRTTIISNFNDPGYLDIGVGGTWNPTPNLFVVIHPLNYNFVFAKNDAIFKSSLGAKIVADYTRKFGAVNFKSNFSTFQSYESGDLSNFTWINSFAYTLWKGIGVGLDFGLRSNKQEALNFATKGYNGLSAADQLLTPAPTFDNVDNKLQTYWVLGLSYNL